MNKSLSSPPIVPIFTHVSALFLRGSWISVTKTLIDSGASSCFMDYTFAVRHKIPLKRKAFPIAVEVIDGRKLESGLIREETYPICFSVGKHKEYLVFHLIKSPNYAIILGMSWLAKHNPSINWLSREVEFSCNCDLDNEKTNKIEESYGGSPVSGPVPSKVPSTPTVVLEESSIPAPTATTTHQQLDDINQKKNKKEEKEKKKA